MAASTCGPWKDISGREEIIHFDMTMAMMCSFKTESGLLEIFTEISTSEMHRLVLASKVSGRRGKR